MIDEKDIQEALEKLETSIEDGYLYDDDEQTVKVIIAAYREKCEEYETLKDIGNDLCFYLKNRTTDVEPDPVIAIRRWKELIK